jgi:hypothetical protein
MTMINYLKAYYEPKTKMLNEMAFQSANQYFEGKKKTITEFQAYKRGYVGAYRLAYAKTKLKRGDE